MLTIFRGSDTPALGDCLIGSLVTHILLDHGVDARFWCPSPEILALLDCPKAERLEPPFLAFDYAPEGAWDGRSILRKALDRCQQGLSRPEPFEITRTRIPVHYRDLAHVPRVDVALGTRCGSWSPLRGWPYFAELQRELTAAGLTWETLDDKRGLECLNWAAKARLYVGLETGTSHYVSQVARRALILQSGYSNIDYWNWYGYQHLAVEVPCGNCFRRGDCPNDHACMRDLSVTTVMTRIESLLADS